MRLYNVGNKRMMQATSVDVTGLQIGKVSFMGKAWGALESEQQGAEGAPVYP